MTFIHIPKKKHSRAIEQALLVFRQKNGILKTSEALKSGIHPREFYSMVRMGLIERLGRGLYRLKEMRPLENPDLIQVALKVPKGIVCLISALSFHQLTTQIPHEVYIALKKGAERPRLMYPQIRPFWFTEAAYISGVETHKIAAIPVKIYSAEKTIADCFKFRNKIGLDTATEALRLYIKNKKLRIEKIEHFANIDRVSKVIRPYLEALL